MKYTFLAEYENGETEIVTAIADTEMEAAVNLWASTLRVQQKIKEKPHDIYLKCKHKYCIKNLSLQTVSEGIQ